MLVLTRKVGEKIKVYGPCEICLVDIDRNKIRIGITADRDVGIFRSELLDPQSGLPTPAFDVPPSTK